MSQKVRIKRKLEEAFKDKVKETESGFKIHTEELNNWDFFILNEVCDMLVPTMGRESVIAKRSGTGITILISVL